MALLLLVAHPVSQFDRGGLEFTGRGHVNVILLKPTVSPPLTSVA
jgi:hypothetical protein